MRSKISPLGFLFGLSIVFTSCVKDIKPIAQNQGPTPYIFQKPINFPGASLPSDNPLTVEGIYLGRMLFYDPIVSEDSSISCSSCHKQINGFADVSAFSKGVKNRTGGRNSMALINMAWQSSFFWDARQVRLRSQVLEPIQDHREMNMNLVSLEKKLKNLTRYKKAFSAAFPENEPSIEHMALALEQFLLTLVSANSKFDQFKPSNQTAFNASEKRGFELFNFQPPLGADCFHCHGGVLANVNRITNNGLDTVFIDKGMGAITGKLNEIGLFKTPTLRNVELTAPYMHDGRFKTLEEVINHYSDNVYFNSPNIDANFGTHNSNNLKLSIQQKADLLAFLKTMTDTSFIHNPAFAPPF